MTRPPRRPLAVALAAALASLFAARGTEAASCSTVTRAYLQDPDGQILTNAFGPDVAINGANDVLFVGRAAGSRHKLYLYPGAGAPEVLARAGGPAPDGGTFRSALPFQSISVNDDGDVGFRGRLLSGAGAFVRESGGALETAGATGFPSPAGGTYDEFPTVSGVNAAGKIAFTATVVGGPHGVYLYDPATDTSSAVILPGDASVTDGRGLCSFGTLGLGDGDRVAVFASSKLDCNDGGESAIQGLFLADGGSIQTVALDGDPSPIGGSVFSRFEDSPVVNAAGHVAFRANVTGVVSTNGVFVFDPAGPTTTAAVVRGNPAPPGGTIGKMLSFRFSDADEIFLRSNLSGTPARFGITAFGGSSRALLVKSDLPPSDLFFIGSTISQILGPGISADGSRFAARVNVIDTVVPRAKRGVLRCLGSPSAAFLDGDPSI